MNVLRRTSLLIALLLAAGGSHAAGVNIGIVAPQDGNFASLGAEITSGANFQVQALKDFRRPSSTNPARRMAAGRWPRR